MRDLDDPIADGTPMIEESMAWAVCWTRTTRCESAPSRLGVERHYGWSVLHCLTVAMLEEDSAGTGTAIRADTVRAYADAAGFTSVVELPIEHDFWRFYRLVS